MPWRSTSPLRQLTLSIFLIIGGFSIAIGHHSGLSEELVATVKKRYGSAAEKRLLDWEASIHQHLSASDREKLNIVNSFFNQAKFIDDLKLWNKKDYWATPVEFLALNAGDCEDFSIAKYFTLKEMGVDTSKLRITYVKALRLNQAHMVLAYYSTPSAVPLILDNLTNQIVPADQRTDLQPVYSFNADDLWLSRTRNEQIRAGKSSQLGLWRELNKRLLKEKGRHTSNKTTDKAVTNKALPSDITTKVPLQKRETDTEKKTVRNIKRDYYPGVSWPLRKKATSLCDSKLKIFQRNGWLLINRPPCQLDRLASTLGISIAD